MTRDEYLIALHGMRKSMVSYSFNRGLSLVEAEEAADKALHYVETHLEPMMATYTPSAAMVTGTTSAALDIVRRRPYLEAMAVMTRVQRQRNHDDLDTLRRDVRAAFATLSPLIQWSAWKVIVEGNTWAHVAEQLGIHPDALKARVLRALHSLRPRLAAYAPFHAKTAPRQPSHRLVEEQLNETAQTLSISAS